MSSINLIDKYWNEPYWDLQGWLYPCYYETITSYDKEDEKIINNKDRQIIKLIKIDLKKEYLKTILEGNVLKVSYKVPKDIKLDDFQCGSFEKKWNVGEGTKKEDVKVSYNGGILKIIVKKSLQPAIESYEIPIE